MLLLDTRKFSAEIGRRKSRFRQIWTKLVVGRWLHNLLLVLEVSIQAYSRIHHTDICM
jgi:hypothetical protein